MTALVFLKNYRDLWLIADVEPGDGEEVHHIYHIDHALVAGVGIDFNAYGGILGESARLHPLGDVSSEVGTTGINGHRRRAAIGSKVVALKAARLVDYDTYVGLVGCGVWLWGCGEYNGFGYCRPSDKWREEYGGQTNAAKYDAGDRNPFRGEMFNGHDQSDHGEDECKKPKDTAYDNQNRIQYEQCVVGIEITDGTICHSADRKNIYERHEQKNDNGERETEP